MRISILILTFFFFISCDNSKNVTSNNANNNTVPEKYDGWYLFSSCSYTNQSCLVPECSYRWGCGYIINRDPSFQPGVDSEDGLIYDYYDCRLFDSDFCSNHYINGNAYCNSTDGECYPSPILCEEDVQCPMYFFCHDGKCIETSRSYTGYAFSDSDIKPENCMVDSDCFYWEICQHNPDYPNDLGLCQTKYCDYKPSESYFGSQCGSFHYCVPGDRYGLVIPYDNYNWPTKPDQTWDHPGDCVETTLCDTNQDCTNPDMPVCDQNRKLCIPTDYPQ